MTSQKPLLRALNGETLARPPVWLMRQAGRYLPEYRKTREGAGSFLDLCYNSELATEVTLQPIRRFGFDAAIVFADILLVPHGLGRKLWFELGEGPRLEPLTTIDDVRRLASNEEMHLHLAPVYETVRRLKSALPPETALIGFAGAPWTVATYMIAGRGKDEQAGALALMKSAPEVFEALIARLVDATAAYLSAQVEAGAEVLKLFDSWAGALAHDPVAFEKWCIAPTVAILARIRERCGEIPMIGFPREAGLLFEHYVRATGVRGIAIDTAVEPAWAREKLQPLATVQGNLDPAFLVQGGARMKHAVETLLETLGNGPYIFNLGHGITPDADPARVEELMNILRNGK